MHSTLQPTSSLFFNAHTHTHTLGTTHSATHLFAICGARIRNKTKILKYKTLFGPSYKNDKVIKYQTLFCPLYQKTKTKSWNTELYSDHHTNCLRALQVQPQFCKASCSHCDKGDQSKKKTKKNKQLPFSQTQASACVNHVLVAGHKRMGLLAAWWLPVNGSNPFTLYNFINQNTAHGKWFKRISKKWKKTT